jgi:hypothetical protein
LYLEEPEVTQQRGGRIEKQIFDLDQVGARRAMVA